MGLGHGSDISKYEYYTIGNGLDTSLGTIDLSYVGTGKTTQSSSDPDFPGGVTTDWKQNWKIPKVSDPKGKEFADALVVGNYMRFTGDPDETLWRIKNIQQFYKWNWAESEWNSTYPEGQPLHDYVASLASTHFGITITDGSPGASPLSGAPYHNGYLYNSEYGTPISMFGSTSTGYTAWAGQGRNYNQTAPNRRLTYRITLENWRNETIPVGGNGFTPFTATGIASSLQGIDILTATEIEDKNDVPFPENPAVFETEPKEDTDLNIFHEASDTISLDISKSAYQFAPIGSIVESHTFGTAGNTSSQAKNLGVHSLSNPVTVAMWLNNQVVQLNIPFINPSVGDTFRFLRPDGTYTVAEFLELGNGDPSSVILNPSTNLPQSVYARMRRSDTVGLGWHNCYSFGNGVESNRIRDTFNSVFIDKGPKVSATLDEGYDTERRKYGLIYSGLYNDISGVNNLNQFISAEKITKEVNPTYGSIQKLYAGWGQGGDLVTLCEDRVLKILANKDALFNADGNTNITSTDNVLGTAIPYSESMAYLKTQNHLLQNLIELISQIKQEVP